MAKAGEMSRRGFLGAAAGFAAAGCCTGGGSGGGRLLFGACRGIRDAALMKRLGYDFFEWGVAAMLEPDKGDAEWRGMKEQILAAALPLRSCNSFLPARFRLTGPKASHGEALDYAEKACRRADEVGVKTIVFGSGGARTYPDAKGEADLRRGEEQFTEFCAKLAERIAGLEVTVAIEPLRAKETNIVNYVRQGQKVVEAVGSPRVRLLADIFHMMSGGEGAESIVKAGSLLKHCHIATAGKRLYPGAEPTDYAPYIAALREIGYNGGISCECGWGKKEELESNLATALRTMKEIA